MAYQGVEEKSAGIESATLYDGVGSVKRHR